MSTLDVERPDPDPYIDACDRWCEHATEGHTYALFPDDRRHWSKEIRLPVPLNDASTDDDFPVATLRVYLQRHDREVEPRITLTLNDVGLHLRLSDAAAVRDVLTTLLTDTEETP